MAANRIKGITVEIGGDTTGLDKALKGVEKSIRGTQSSLRDVNRLLKLDPTNTKLLAQKQKMLSEAVGSTKEKLDALKRAQEQAKAQLESGELGQDKYDALQREIIETEQELRRLQEQAIESNATLAKIEEVGEKLEGTGEKISGVGQKLMPVTAGVAALGTAAVKVTSDFDSSMSQVQATMGITSDAMTDLDGVSVNTMDSLRDLAKEMGSKTAFSASECADAMNYLALAGYDTQEIYDTLPTVLNLAASGGIDLATASDMVTDAMSALGMETSEADTMVDQMARTSSATNTSVAQLGEGILKIGATAKSVKGGTAELNTALGVLANNGIKGAEGGTHLRNIILALQNPTDTAADQIEELGLSIYDSEGNMRSMNDILGDLNDSMRGMTSKEKNNIISKIFNKTDLSAANALLANTGDAWEELQKSISDSGGAAQQMADTQLDNLSGQLTLLKSALEGLAISFGEILMPMVRSAVEKIQSFIEKLNSMDESQKRTIAKIAAAAAALGPLLIVIGKLTSLVGSGMKAYAALAKGVAKIGIKAAASSGSVTSLGGAIGAAAGPILAVAAVIGTLVAAFKHLWDTNTAFRNAIIGIWDDIKAKFEEFTQGIVDRLNALGFDFESITNVLKAIWEGFCSVLAPVFEGAFSAVSAALGYIFDALTGLLDVFIGLFTGDWTQFWTGIQEIFSGIWNGITGIFTAVMDTIRGIADVVLGWFGTSWNEIWTSIASTFSGIWNGIVSFFANAWNTMKNTVTTVTSAIGTAVEKIKAVFKSLGQSIKSIFTSIKNTISNIWNGIKSTLVSVVDSIKSKIQTTFNNVKSTISNIFTSIKDTAKKTWDKVKSNITEPIEKAKSKIKDIVDKIKGFFNVKISFPHVPLPHFSIKPKGWKVKDLLKGSIPSLGISWYKEGGIFNNPSIIGVGEAGTEAVLPIEKLNGMFNAMADNIISGMSVLMRANNNGAALGGDIQLNMYLYPSGPKMGEQIVRAYDIYKARLS